MRVLFVNRYFYPDHAPTGVLLSDVAFALSRAGTHVTVVTSRLRYDGSSRLTSSRETVDGVEIHRLWTSQGSRSGLLGRSLDYGSFYLVGGWHLWRLARHADVIVAKTDPPLLSVIVAAIAKLRGKKTVNWLQDIFPEIAEALDVGGTFGRFAFRSLRPLRNWSLRAASANVVVGDAMAAHLLKEGIEPSKISMISNWTDGALIRPVPSAQNRLRKDWALEERFVVGYAGNLGRAHEIDTVIDAITLVQERAVSDRIASRVVFVFVGGGAQHTKLAREVSRRRLTNVQIHPYQPREHLAETLSVADLHMVSLNPKLEGLILPSKFYGIAAAGRPALFIGSANGEIAQLLHRNDCGFAVSPDDARGLAARILELASDPQGCARMGRQARAAFEANWNKTHTVQQWIRLLKKTYTQHPNANARRS
jgi:colanic acid biosynthesis glycosyl transferase WcaI